MKQMIAFFQDNAMFYKDVTQWLRNRTFGSLFFGLLIVAEILSLFIIFRSDDINEPGAAMFGVLFLVLTIYAVIIGYLGNSLTSKEFSNRTFELFELSGMSLEMMVGGKLVSMIYQFFFGFCCLVPFMFFSYFLGGIDFFEMIVGVLMIAIFTLPFYLVSLMMGLGSRLKQISVIVKLASFFLLFWFVGAMFMVFLSGQFLDEFIRWITDSFKRMFAGEWEIAVVILSVIAVYAQVCLLLFYLSCNAISRQTDSREIPIKILTMTLIISWMLMFYIFNWRTGSANLPEGPMVVPVFVVLLTLAMMCYYNRPAVPPIVEKRYRDAGPLRRAIFWMFQPGMAGGMRTIFLLIGVTCLGFSLLAGVGTADKMHVYLAILVQIPWFLSIPHIFFAWKENYRHNYAGQKSAVLACWVIGGVLLTIYFSWVGAGIYGGSYGRNSVGVFDVFLSTLVSPLTSMGVLSSSDALMESMGTALRYGSGIFGMVLMMRYVSRVTAMERELTERMEIEGGGAPVTTLTTSEVVADAETDAPVMTAEPAPSIDPESTTEQKDGQ